MRTEGRDISKMVELEFFTTIPPQNIYFNNHPQTRVPMWESRSLPEKFQYIAGAKCLEKTHLKKTRTAASFYPGHSSLKVAQFNAKRDSPHPQPQSVISLTGESESTVSD